MVAVKGGTESVTIGSICRHNPVKDAQIFASWNGNCERFYVLYEAAESDEPGAVWRHKLATAIEDAVALINGIPPCLDAPSAFLVCVIQKGHYTAFYVFYKQ
jgi:hypothetical protein